MDADRMHEAWPVEIDDRRAEPRRATEFDAYLELPDGLIHGVVTNISFSGALFVTRNVTHVIPVGCRVKVVVAPRPEAGTGELTWHGVLVRNERSGDDGPPRIAYAVSFGDEQSGPLPGQGFLD